MSKRPKYARFGLEVRPVGNSGDLAVAIGGMTRTASNRIGLYADTTASAEKLGIVIGGTEVARFNNDLVDVGLQLLSPLKVNKHINIGTTDGGHTAIAGDMRWTGVDFEGYDGGSWSSLGGGGASSPLTSKGDLWGFSTVDARVPVGANTTVLKSASGEVLGLEWAAVTWAEVDKTTSSLADITTRTHTDLTDIGTNTHAQIDTHISAAFPHSGTLAQLNTAVTDATLDDSSASRTPTAHASTHQNAGGDEISVASLSGLLADPQTPLTHAASHSDGGTDEVTVEDLATASTTTTHVLSPDGSGGVTMRAESAGGGSVILDWNFGTGVTDVNPGNKKFTLNNADRTAATFVYINDTSGSGIDATNIISALSNGDQLYIQKGSDSDVSVLYNVTGDPTDGTGYWKVPVTYNSDGISAFTNNDSCGFVFLYEAGGGAGGHTIQDTDGNDLTARTNLRFKSPLTPTDNAGDDATDINLDLPNVAFPARSSFLTLSVNQTTGLTVGQPIRFDTIAGDHTLDTYKVTVPAGTTAFLEANLRVNFATLNSTGLFGVQWYNVTESDFVADSNSPVYVPIDRSSSSFDTAKIAKARVTTSVDTEYELRITAAADISSLAATECYATVEEVGAASTGSNVVDSQTASTSATLDFDVSSFDGPVEFDLENLLAATDGADLYIRISTDGGSTYKSAGYLWSSQWQYNTLAADTYKCATSTALGDTSGLKVTVSTDSGSDGGICGRVTLSNPSGTAAFKRFQWQVSHDALDDNSLTNDGGGKYNTDTGAVTNVRFVYDTGNIASGKIRMIDPLKAAEGTPIGWTDWSPTIAPFTTNYTVNGQYQHKDYTFRSLLEVDFSDVPAGSGTVEIDLPAGITIDTTTLGELNLGTLGRVGLRDSGIAIVIGNVSYADTNTIRLRYFEDPGSFIRSVDVTSTTPFAPASGDKYNIWVELPTVEAGDAGAGSGGAFTYAALTDTPATLTANTLQRVNAAGTALENAQTTEDASGNILSVGEFTTPNNEGYNVKDSGGTARKILNLSAADICTIGLGASGGLFQYFNNSLTQRFSASGVILSSGKTLLNDGGTPNIGDGTNRFGTGYFTTLDVNGDIDALGNLTLGDFSQDVDITLKAVSGGKGYYRSEEAVGFGGFCGYDANADVMVMGVSLSGVDTTAISIARNTALMTFATDVVMASGKTLTNAGGTPNIGDGTNRFGTGYFTTLDVSGDVTIAGTTDATSTTAASLKTAGGLAVAKSAHFGGAVTPISASNTVVIGKGIVDVGEAIGLRGAGSNTIAASPRMFWNGGAGDKIALQMDASNNLRIWHNPAVWAVTATWKPTGLDLASGKTITNAGGTPNIGDGTNRFGTVYGTDINAATSMTINAATTYLISGYMLNRSDADFVQPYLYENSQSGVRFYALINGTTGSTFGFTHDLILECSQDSSIATDFIYSAFDGEHLFKTGTSRLTRVSVTDNGLVMASGKTLTAADGTVVIDDALDVNGDVTLDAGSSYNSANGNTTHFFGVAWTGYDGTTSDVAGFGHRTSRGQAGLYVPSDGSCTLRHDDTDTINFSDDGTDVVKISDVLELVGVTSDPTSPVDGSIWYRSDTDVFHVQADGLTKTITVT